MFIALVRSGVLYNYFEYKMADSFALCSPCSNITNIIYTNYKEKIFQKIKETMNFIKKPHDKMIQIYTEQS